MIYLKYLIFGECQLMFCDIKLDHLCHRLLPFLDGQLILVNGFICFKISRRKTSAFFNDSQVYWRVFRLP